MARFGAGGYYVCRLIDKENCYIMKTGPRRWLIKWLELSTKGSNQVHVPFYVAGDGVAYAEASEVLKSTVVKQQLDDVRALRELSMGRYSEKSSAA